jgi:hypothetical protein
MKKLAACLILLSACLLMAPAASANWGGFISTGKTTGIGNPSCAPVSAGQVACAVRSGKSVIMVNQFNGTKWGTWKSLAGTVNSDPSCTSDGSGKVYCAATASNGNLQVTVLSGGSWSNPTKVSAALYSSPSCAELTAGQVLCAARSASGGLGWSLYNGTAWSKFASLAASTVSAPSCTSDHNGGVICAVFISAEATLVSLQRYKVAGFPKPRRSSWRQSRLHILPTYWGSRMLRESHRRLNFCNRFQRGKLGHEQLEHLLQPPGPGK